MKTRDIYTAAVKKCGKEHQLVLCMEEIGKGLLTKLETLTHDACIVFCLHRGIIFPHITERVLRHIRLCELCLYGHQRRGCFRCS